jgi:hypothetical protein
MSSAREQFMRLLSDLSKRALLGPHPGPAELGLRLGQLLRLAEAGLADPEPGWERFWPGMIASLDQLQAGSRSYRPCPGRRSTLRRRPLS